MTPPEPPAPTVETLLPYAGFMRRLAGHIAGNEADAADLEQEAWLAAMRRPPRAEGAIRTWLGIVMGNRRRQQIRGASRVGRRERAAARPEGQGETPDQVLAHAETKRVLVEAVLALPEPYRRTIILRYLDERSAEEIAELMEVPAATVRQRTKRGLERLREVLDERHGGDRRSWLAALGVPIPATLAPSGTPPPGGGAFDPAAAPAPRAPTSSPTLPTPSIGTLGVGAASRTLPNLLVAGLLLGLLGTGTWMGLRLGGGTDAAPTPLVPTPADDPAGTGLAGAGKRADGPPSTAPTPPVVDVPRGRARVTGEVRVAANGRPAAGAVVRAMREGAEISRTTVSATGTFALEGLPGGGPTSIEAVREGAATVRRAGLSLVEGTPRDVGTLWLDAAIRVDVRVIGTAAAAVKGAKVRAFRTRSTLAPEDWEGRAEEAVAERTTGADGLARFDDLAAERWTFRAEASGLAVGSASLETARRGGAVYAVTIALETGYPLSGRVRSATGEPVAGLPVLVLPPREAMEAREPAPLGPVLHATTTGTDGRYRFDAIPRGAWSLAVRSAGGLPARVGVLEVPGVSTFDVTLDGGRVVGRVTQEGTGSPLEGVAVRLAVWRRHHPTYLTATSGPDGRYRIDVPLGGLVNGPSRGEGEAEAKTVHFDASKPGYVRVPVADAGLWTNPWVFGGEETTVDVVMRPAAALAGTVVGPEGAVAGATVTVDLWDPFAGLVRASTVTDGAGRWRVDGLAEGRARLAVTKEGLVQEPSPGGGWRDAGGPATSAIVDVPRVGEVARELRLVAGAFVVGHVVDAEGHPVAGATVEGIGRGDVVPTGTDTEGAFQVGGVRAGETVALRIARPGSIPATVKAPAGGPPLTVVLRATGTVRGRVTAEGGRPAAGAFVQVALAKAVLEERYEVVAVWQTALRVPVDADGRFEAPLPVDASGERKPVIVRAVASGFAPGATAALDVPATGALEGVTVGLSKGYEVRGRIVNDAGEPVAGAQVELVNADLPPALGNGRDWSSTGIAMHPFEIVAVSDDEGRFVVRDLPPWTYALRATAADHAWGTGEMRVPGGDEPTIVLAKENRISGRVRYADGTPVAHALVVALDPTTGGVAGQDLAGHDGRFELQGLAAGTYVIEARTPGHVAVDVLPSRTAPVEVGRTDVEVVAARGVGALRGRCVGPEGRPVPGAALHCKPLAGGNVVHGRSDPDGRFTLLGLAAGPYALAAEASRTLGGPEAFGTPLVADVRGLVAGAEVVLEFKPAVEIRGRIVREDGAPLHPQASVRIRRAGDSTWTRFAPVATDGTFAARNLGAGTYELAVVAPGAQEPLARATAETGTKDVRITIPRAN